MQAVVEQAPPDATADPPAPPPHDLAPVRTRVSTCMLCRHPSVGTVLSCKRCGLLCHERCVGCAQEFSCALPLADESTFAPHSCVRARVGALRACDLCGSLIGPTSSAVRCLCCPLRAHETCATRAPLSPCLRAMGLSAPAHAFQPLHAPRDPSAACAACSGALRGPCYACAWCGAFFHGPCLASAGSCTLGPLAQLIRGDSALVVVVNADSGARQGAALLARLRRKLDPAQVFDVGGGAGPAAALAYAAQRGPRWRLLVCGGDGTVSWTMQELRTRGLAPPEWMCVIPLGTGNDLARSLGWGGGWGGCGIGAVLADIGRANPEQLDVWEARQDDGALRPFCNYFSLGIDASVALRFHEKRERNREAFGSRVGNKAAYFWCGVEDFFSRARTLRGLGVRVEVDGRALDLGGCQGVSFVNISSCHAGKDLWGSPGHGTGFAAQSPSDGTIEVVGFGGIIELAAIETYVARPTRLAQGKDVRVVVPDGVALPAQADGEPFFQSGATIGIRHSYQATVLRAPHGS